MDLQRSPPHLEPDHVGDLHPIEETLDLGDPTASSNRLEIEGGKNTELAKMSEQMQAAGPEDRGLMVPRKGQGRGTTTWKGRDSCLGKGLPTPPHLRCRATKGHKHCAMWEGSGDRGQGGEVPG